MHHRHLALAVALLTAVPSSSLIAARATVAPALVQTAQAALALGNQTALRDVFAANPSNFLLLAVALTDANPTAAGAIAGAAAKAFPAQVGAIVAALTQRAPGQREQILAATATPPAGDGLPVFPVTAIDPVIVSPSS